MTTTSGPIQVRCARSSGTRIEVWRSVDFGDEQTAPWVTVCEHGSICEHDTRELAVAWASVPEQWCETGCRHAVAGRRCVTCGSTKTDFHGDMWACVTCGDEWACTCSDCLGETG